MFTSTLSSDVSNVAASPDGSSVYVLNPDFFGEGEIGVVSLFRPNPDGSLAQPTGTDGCIGDGGAGDICTVGRALGGAKDAVVSPDGKNVYVAASGANAIAVLKRAPDGTLTQSEGTDGCISQDGFDADGGEQTCTDGRALEGVAKLAISPDGKFVYAVASSVNGVSVFRRNDDGSLTQLDETDGCISDNGDDGDDGQSCASGRQLYEPTGAAISPDGATLYIAVSEARPNCESECQTRSHGPGAIVVLQRNAATGVLTQAEDASGCMTDLSRYLNAPTCRNAHGLEDLLGVAVSPDGKNVYAVGQGSGPIEVHPGALTIFARSATDGTLQQLDGTAGCVSNNGTEGGGGNDRAALADGDVCGRANGMLEPSGLAISADGANVYTMNEDSAAVAAFSRDASTGAVAQLPGTEGCVSDDGTPSGDPPSNLCTDGRALVEATRMAIVGCTAYVVARDSNAVDVFRRCTPASSAALPSCSPSGDITFTVTGRPGDAVAKTLHLRVDGGDDQKLATPAANPATVTVHFAAGTHALEFWAEDEQGLTEAHHTGSLKVGNCPQPPSGAVLGNTQGSHQCTSRRVVRIRLRKSVLRGAHVTSVTVKLVKPVRKFTVKHTGGRIRSTINLRNLPRARYTIAITVRLSDGRTLTGKRHYFTCTPARRGGLPRL